LVPYGFLMAPIGGGLFILLPFLVSLSGIYQNLFILALSLPLGMGLVEAINAYEIIGQALSPRIQNTKTVMRIGLFLLAIPVALFVIPDTASNAFSVQTPFPQVFEWTGLGALMLATVLLGGASWIIWERWSQTEGSELGIAYWRRPSRAASVFPLGCFALVAGFFLSESFPMAALVLFSLGSVLLVAGILPRNTEKVQPARGPDTSLAKVELRKVPYEEKLVVGRRACELILQKYGRRRILAVCMWGDETENSQPYFGVNLLVVVRDGIRLPVQTYLFNGIEVKITYWEEIGILHRARTFDDEWPWQSASYRTRIVLYERKGWLRKMDRAAEESDLADSTNAVGDSALVLLRHLATLRDYQLQSDLVGEKAECWQIAWGAIELVFLLNHRYARRDYWKEVFECPIQTFDFRRQLEILLEVTSTSMDVMVGTAEKLCEELLEMVRSRRIGLTSSELKV